MNYREIESEVAAEQAAETLSRQHPGLGFYVTQCDFTSKGQIAWSVNIYEDYPNQPFYMNGQRMENED